MVRIHALAAFALLFLIVPASASQGVGAQPVPTAPTAAVDAVVPTTANTTCPIMGKPISTRLFTDTRHGRIYICCKACIKDIQADAAHAYKTAYPTTEKVENKLCPVTGKAIAKDAVRVELQGRDFLVVDKAAAAIALEETQATLAKLADPKLVEVQNRACPVTGEVAAKNTVAVIDGRIVRFATPKAIEDARKDAAKTLARALELRAEEQRAEATPKPKGG